MIITYIKNMFFHIVIFIPIYLLFRIIFVKIKKIDTSFKKEFLLGIFVLYMIGLLSQTIIPDWDIGIDDLSGFYFDIHFNTNRQYNIIPFHTIYGYLFTSNNFVSNWDKVSLLNLAANLALFMPFGFLLPLVSQNIKTYKKVLICGIILVLIIEFIQYFIGRSADVDDVILNMIGITLGYLFYKCLQNNIGWNYFCTNIDGNNDSIFESDL